MSMFHWKKGVGRFGFSLIELLIVIAVIGILTAVMTANFNTSREKAKNKALMSSFKEVQLALELYKSQNGHYPAALSTGSNACRGGGSEFSWARHSQSSSCSNIRYIEGLTPEFIDSLPSYRDSANDGNNASTNCVIYYYVDGVSQSWYKLLGRRCISGATSPEDGGIPADHELASVPEYCDGSQPGLKVYNEGDSLYYASIAVYSPGGECY